MVTITQTNDFISSHKQGSLSVTRAVITKALGFEPQEDLCEKVSLQWDFIADGKPCSIWDYKGTMWSFFGPTEIFEALFGQENVKQGGWA